MTKLGGTELLKTVNNKHLSTNKMLLMCFMGICSHLLCMWSIKTLAKVFLVEPHGGDNAARGPIDHDVCQQVI